VCVWNKLWTVTTLQLGNVDVNSSRSFISDNETSKTRTHFLHRFLCAFAKLRKSRTVLASSCLSDRMEELGAHWMDFRDIWCLSIFRKPVGKIQGSLNPDKNNGYFTRRPMYIYDNTSLNFSYDKKCLRHKCRENKSIHCMFSNFFPKNVPFMR